MYMFNLNQWTDCLKILWAIVALIHIKPVYSSVSYEQATNPKYDRRGHKSPSGYGPLLTKRIILIL